MVAGWEVGSSKNSMLGSHDANSSESIGIRTLRAALSATYEALFTVLLLLGLRNWNCIWETIVCKVTSAHGK